MTKHVVGQDVNLTEYNRCGCYPAHKRRGKTLAVCQGIRLKTCLVFFCLLVEFSHLQEKNDDLTKVSQPIIWCPGCLSTEVGLPDTSLLALPGP